MEVNGQKVDTDHALATLLEDYAVGDTLSVAYLRDGARHTVSLTLTERPQG